MFDFFYSLFGPSDCNPESVDTIKMVSILVSVVVPIVVSSMYYFVVCGKVGSSSQAKLKNWLAYYLLSVLIPMITGIAVCYSVDCATLSMLIVSTVLSFVIAVVVFFGSSVIFKSKSLYAKYVPDILNF